MRRNPFHDYLATIVGPDEFAHALRTGRRDRSTAVSAWLYDYEDEEIARASRIADSQASRDLVNIRDFFPEVNLSSSYCDRIPGVPVWVLLPFFEQVIVWLEPVRSARSFVRLYGLTPDAFADLCEDRAGAGKIIPLLNAPPSAFHGLSHFARILQLRPPTLWRDFLFQRSLYGAAGLAAARREAENTIPKSLSGRRRFASLRSTNRGTVRDLAVSCYCQICAFGGQELARAAVVRSRSGDAVVDKLFYYAVALYDSFVSPLGGTYPCSRDQLRGLASAVDPRMHPTAELFPRESAEVLSKPYRFPCR